MSNEWTIAINAWLLAMNMGCVALSLKMLTEYWKDKGKK